MPISSNIVGHEIPAKVVEVTTRMLLAYAAGIGETDPRYFDDASPAGIVAPPSFCAALEWPIMNERMGNGILDISDEEAAYIVRTGQDSTFHQPIRPGDKLSTSGQIVQVKETSAGALLVQKLVTVEESTGKPVVTSWVSWMMRGGCVEGESREIATCPVLDIEGPSKDELMSSQIYISRKTPHVYSECSGIWNPINSQRKVALAAGLPDVILHGMATWSFVGREILKENGGNNPQQMKRFTADFKSRIFPGATIHIYQGRCHSHPEVVYYRVENQKGEVAVTGFALLEAV
jgi:acyl dehydratase